MEREMNGVIRLIDHLTSSNQYILAETDLKIPRFVLFWANLSHFRPKSDPLSDCYKYKQVFLREIPDVSYLIEAIRKPRTSSRHH